MQTIGRLPLDDHLLEVPPGFDLLTVSAAHCKVYARLSMHHRDPFDRMLVAQAQSEGVLLLTRDRRLLAYAGEAEILRSPGE